MSEAARVGLLRIGFITDPSGARWRSSSSECSWLSKRNKATPI